MAGYFVGSAWLFALISWRCAGIGKSWPPEAAVGQILGLAWEPLLSSGGCELSAFSMYCSPLI